MDDLEPLMSYAPHLLNDELDFPEHKIETSLFNALELEVNNRAYDVIE